MSVCSSQMVLFLPRAGRRMLLFVRLVDRILLGYLNMLIVKLVTSVRRVSEGLRFAFTSF